MKHEPKAQFSDSGGTAALTMMQAIEEAKNVISSMTSLPIDSICHCQKDADQTWTIAIDVIESAARMGDNDLLASYEVLISKSSELLSFQRLRRYHREDRQD